MSVAIVDYGSGNLHSAAKAFERAARSMENPQKITVTADPEAVYRADRIVLPGVGAFADCRRGLDAVNGMLEAMTEAVRVKARPFFGICVGMQLMATRGKEHVVTEGFNWIAGDVEKIAPREENLKIPHMGWNTLDMIREHPVLERLPLGPKGRHAYFVHSYHLNASNEADVLVHGVWAVAAHVRFFHFQAFRWKAKVSNLLPPIQSIGRGFSIEFTNGALEFVSHASWLCACRPAAPGGNRL